MEREIKFKVFNPHKGIFVGIEYLSHDGWKSETTSGSAQTGCFNDQFWGHEESCPRMQFTGKKSKNGEEIYDGSIVRVRGTKRIGIYITQVIWKGNGWCLRENNTYMTDRASLMEVVEVIGSIQETPELLTNTVKGK